jgi:hypothetical protein
VISKNIKLQYKTTMWIHELKCNNMNPSRFPGIDIKILKSVNLQHVACDCEEWEFALKGDDKELIKRKSDKENKNIRREV